MVLDVVVFLTLVNIKKVTIENNQMIAEVVVYKIIVIVKGFVGRYFVVLNSGVIAINLENMVVVCIVDTSYEVVELLVELVVITDGV